MYCLWYLHIQQRFYHKNLLSVQTHISKKDICYRNIENSFLLISMDICISNFNFCLSRNRFQCCSKINIIFFNNFFTWKISLTREYLCSVYFMYARASNQYSSPLFALNHLQASCLFCYKNFFFISRRFLLYLHIHLICKYRKGISRVSRLFCAFSTVSKRKFR